jgi:hypothetical protein
VVRPDPAVRGVHFEALAAFKLRLAPTEGDDATGAGTQKS